MNLGALHLGLPAGLSGTARGSAFYLDRKLLGVALIILILGLVVLGSASISIAEQLTGKPFYYLWRQLGYAAVGLCLATALFAVPIAVWERMGPALIILSVLLLLLVFVPGLGRTVNGSTRWIAFAGFNVQVSEFVKLFCIIYLAGYLVRHTQLVRTELKGFIRPLLLLQVVVFLLLLEPDYGAAAVLLATAMGMMWLGGARFVQFAVLGLLVAAALALLAVSSPYRLERLTAFLNPWADPFNSGFQLTQALIAFGRGEWLGVGLGSSVQKMFYLPEAHTDFVFSVLGEELGLIGVVIVILLYTFLILRLLRIGRHAEQRELPFHAYLAYGIALWIGMQAYINIGVNMGVLPTKGLTLPLMSYGGSSIVVTCLAISLVLRVDYETRKDDRCVQNKRRLG
ncbi:MAG: putative lipid II flippase FtsW [Gammaproteobacteria bacterium]